MNSKFEKWAKGFSGCDGGNPNGKIWICGIEWGGDSPKSIEEIKEKFKEDVSDIKNCTGYEDYRENMEYPYNKRAINILAAISDAKIPAEEISECKYINRANEKEKYFTKDSNSCKLNLSPFNFPSTDEQHWANEYRELTGFETKSEYQDWVWEKRMCLFQDSVKKYKPALILTFGTTYIKQYKNFFGFKDIELKEKSYNSDSRLSLKYASQGGTLFVNAYFLSRGWLVSSKALKETGDIIRELLKKFNINY